MFVWIAGIADARPFFEVPSERERPISSFDLSRVEGGHFVGCRIDVAIERMPVGMSWRREVRNNVKLWVSMFAWATRVPNASGFA